MKGIFLGVVGLGGIGTAAYVGGGGSGPNDYVGLVRKSPEAVYAAFSALGPEGITSVPSADGWGARMVQRVIKVPNEKVRLELLIDDKPMITAEVQLAPAPEGTRLAAELDFDQALIEKIIQETGEDQVPGFMFQESMIDHVFAQAMGEMVQQIESGEPLASLSVTKAKWGSGGHRRMGAPMQHPSGGWQQRSATRPQISARPTVDPTQAARDHVAKQGPGQAPGHDSGW